MVQMLFTLAEKLLDFVQRLRIFQKKIFPYTLKITVMRQDVYCHISTQANNTNYETYRFWFNLGAKRVVSARELSLEEIREIRAHIPEDMEIETFIHGAMCISYSGRCLLSNFMAGRDAN